MLELRTIRVVPWDVGRLLSATDQTCLTRALATKPEWRILDGVERTLPSGCFLFAEFNHEECSLTLSIFDDGIGVFEFVESCVTYDQVTDFDPETIADSKRNNHLQILCRRHLHSEALGRVMADIRAAMPPGRARLSASPGWEQQGLSYVFSYFILSFTSEEAASQVEQRVSRLLFPLHTQSMDDKSQIATVDLTWPLDRGLSGGPEGIKTVEVRPNLKVLASWSTMCVVGNLGEKDYIYFRNIQVSVQHCWFFCYVLASHIEHQFRALRSTTNPRKVARIDQDISELRMQLTEVRYVRSSMARLSEFSLFELLVESSRLEVLIRRVDDISAVFQERYSNLLSERRIRSARIFELLLFVFAALSAIDAYFSIMSYVQIRQEAGAAAGRREPGEKNKTRRLDRRASSPPA
jgi:hypothetical protein